MKKRKFPVLSIVLFAFAGLILIYAVWAAFYSIDIISTLVSQNQLIISGNEFDLTTFFMTNVGQYLVFTLVLFSLGWIYQDNPSFLVKSVEASSQPLSPDEFTDDDYDEESFEDLDETSPEE